MIPGIDVSLWDQLVDWKNHDWKYAFIKVSEGTVTDPVFADQWKAARGHVLRSGYHFFRPRVSPVDAANKFLSLLKSDPGELPPVLDLEAADNVSDVPERALKWLQIVKRETGRTPIVYTSPNFINVTHMAQYLEFGNYFSWIATYPWDEISTRWTEEQRDQRLRDVLTGAYPYVYPNAPLPWRGKATFVQWTGKCNPVYIPGYPLGAKKAVDVNFYWGTETDLQIQFDAHLPEGDDMSSKPITWTASLKEGFLSNLRISAGLAGGYKQTLTGPMSLQGTGAAVNRDGYTWAEVILPVTGWVALTASYTNIVWLNTPIPAPDRAIVKSTILFRNADGSVTEEELFPKTTS